ncbi:MAG: cation:proton antiporter [Chloroflexi bacterium]|nr:cation:proton antiporter [Chloroflexota bacterium]
MPEPSLFIDFVVALAAALVGGAVAHRLRQPVMVGYLLAGMVVGPYVLGGLTEVGRVRTLAEMGVVFLMFALGAEFSLARVGAIRRVALLGGGAQIGLTIGLGWLLGLLLGLDGVSRLFLGSLIALSSTVVALRLFMDRGDIESLHGRIALGILIVQDLSVVPMTIILPALAQPSGELLLPLIFAAAKAALILAGTFYLGSRWVPRLLFRAAATQSRELFLLTIISLALGTALGTYALGLSLAFGAFLAGLVVSESEFSHQVVAEVVPLRDVFATFFFVSVGMLIDPTFLLQNAPVVLLVVGIILVGKLIITTGVVLLFRYPGQTALLVGAALSQIGEFSFVLARLGVDQRVISEHLYSLTLAGAVLTLLLTPAMMALVSPLLSLLQHIPLVEYPFRKKYQEYPQGAGQMLSHHVVICGFGRVGFELADALERRGFRYLVIEHNPHIVQGLRQRGIPCIYGDAANPAVLERANLSRARVLAVTIPDAISGEVAVRNAKRLNPKLDIIARAQSYRNHQDLAQAGAAEVVRPQFEAALEFIRHTLHRYGVTGPEIQHLLSRKREEHYEHHEPLADQG